MKKSVLTLFCLSVSLYVIGQQSGGITQSKEQKTNPFKIFIAYDLGEMAFNNFQNFSGELGVKFSNQHMLRFVYSNVKLTEGHLSSDFAQAVDGDNVEGLYKSYELLYDIPIYKVFYMGGVGGYVNDNYNHTFLDESVSNNSITFGLSLSLRETNIFKVKGLYYNLCVPIRYYLNPLEETRLGDSIVNEHLIENSIWFFIGYEF